MITQLYCENYTFFLFLVGVLGIFLNQKSIIIIIPPYEGAADGGAAGWAPPRAQPAPLPLPWAPVPGGDWAAPNSIGVGGGIGGVGGNGDRTAGQAWERDVRPRLPERGGGGSGWSLPPQPLQAQPLQPQPLQPHPLQQQHLPPPPPPPPPPPVGDASPLPMPPPRRRHPCAHPMKQRRPAARCVPS